MKERTREEILDSARQMVADAQLQQEVIEQYFPELKESEGEKTKRLLYSIAHKMSFHLHDIFTEKEFQCFDAWCNAWIKKQGEQKSKKVSLWKHWKDGIAGNGEGQLIYLVKIDNTYRLTSYLGFECDYIELSELDKLLEKQGKTALEAINEKTIDNAHKVEPKDYSNIDPHFFRATNNVEPEFKVDDWIVSATDAVRIVSLNDELNCYIAVTTNNEKVKIPYYFDNGRGHMCAYHLWTIKDAKDGDILVCKNGWTCIFKTLVNDETFSSYCFMDHTKWFCEIGSECHTLNEEVVKAYNGKLYPATKEQRDILFSKIKESGYMWDYKSKKLIKLNSTWKY